MSEHRFSVPHSAYSKAYPQFDHDGSFSNIDDSIDGDISLTRERFRPNDNEESDSSFDDLLEVPTSRKGSIFQEPTSLKPRGYEFKLKNTGCLIYLTYPVNTIDIDSYGKIEYELQTKEKSMVVIIPNSRGLSVNNRKLADAYSIRSGCVVAIVDIYFNDPLNFEKPTENIQDSFISKLKNYTVEVTLNLKINYWLQSHSVFGVFNDEEERFQTTTNWNNIKDVIEELLTTHEVENSVIVGFSFGANVAARLAIESEDERIKSIVLVHPLFLPKNCLKYIKKSLLLIVGNEDNFYNKKDLDKFQHDLNKKNDPENFKFIQFKLKPDSPHGFGIAGDYSPMKISNFPTRTCEKVISWILSKI